MLVGSGAFGTQRGVAVTWNNQLVDSRRRPTRERGCVYSGDTGLPARSRSIVGDYLFYQTTVAHLVEGEDSFQDAERMFDFGPYSGLTAVLRTLYFVYPLVLSGWLHDIVRAYGAASWIAEVWF